MEANPDKYYVPHGTYWPIIGSIGLFLIVAGAALMMNQSPGGSFISLAGVAVLLVMLFGWFGTVIGESERGAYNRQVDASFRWGMSWFIFSEVMFFAVFFGTLLYARQLVVPWLAGEGNNFFTHFLLWDGFENAWPTSGPGRTSFRDHAALGHSGHQHGDPSDQRRDDHAGASHAARRQAPGPDSVAGSDLAARCDFPDPAG
jgi:hypothetical protein